MQRRRHRLKNEMFNQMTTEERIKEGLRLIKEDNYLKAFDVFCKLFYDFPKEEIFKQTCLSLLDKIVEGNYDFEPETAEQFHFRGVSKFYKHELQASILDFDKAIKMNPKLDYAIKCKAFSLTHLGEYELAIACLNEAIKLKPAGEYFDDLAENYSKIGDNEKTLFYHEKATQHSPNDERLWYNYGTHLGKMGQTKKAIEMFDKAIKIYPQYEDAIHNRAYYVRLLNQ